MFGINREVTFTEYIEVSTESFMSTEMIGKQFTETLPSGNIVTWELAPVPDINFVLIIRSQNYKFKTSLSNINNMPQKESKVLKRKIIKRLRKEDIIIKFETSKTKFAHL